jgi:hypothetical protein
MRPHAGLAPFALASILTACSGTNGTTLAGADASSLDDSGAPASSHSDGGTSSTPSDAAAPVPDDASPPSGGYPDAAPDAAPLGDAGDASTSAPVDAAAPTQALAIPMYLDPPAPAWTMETSAAAQVPLLVANPDSGPGSSADSAYTQAIATAHGAGQAIIGYVHTSYGARAIAQVEADIDSWYSFYPAIDGIFSDETATAASLVASYYAPLYSYVKAKGGKAVVVINPGTPPDESYMTASDIVLSFEDTYANYGSAQTPVWTAGYPSGRFWHIVLSATQAEMTTAVSLARQRNVGLVYVTDQGPATAYQQIVTGAYWEAELAAVTAP